MSTSQSTLTGGVWLMPGGERTERVLQADSLAEEAKRSRTLIEQRRR